jgi:CBS domain-containing protein
VSELPAGALANWRVSDVMSAPIRACAADIDLVTAARLMVDERIHAVAVLGLAPGPGEDPPMIGVLSDLDLVSALDAGNAGATVGEVAGPPAHSIPSDASLSLAAHQMREARAHHLIVVAPNSGRPVGVISTLDIAQVVSERPGS